MTDQDTGGLHARHLLASQTYTWSLTLEAAGLTGDGICF